MNNHELNINSSIVYLSHSIFLGLSLLATSLSTGFVQIMIGTFTAVMTLYVFRMIHKNKHDKKSEEGRS